MKVEHLYTTSAKLDNLPIKDGRIIVLTDKPAAYYDMGGKRNLIGSDLKEVLQNYYTKSETKELIKDFQTAQQVAEMIAKTQHLTKAIVTSTEFVTEEDILYLIKDDKSDIYLQYILLDGQVVNIGSTKTDLSDYYKKEEVDNLIKDFQDEDDVKLLISQAQMLKRKIVQSVTEVVSEDVLYLILVDKANNTYSQWMFIEGTAVMVGTTYIDLTEYAKTEEVKQLIAAAVSSVYKPQGSVATYNDLPTSGMEVGWVYNVLDTGMNYAWTEQGWDALGDTVDLTDYATKEYVHENVPSKITDLTNDFGELTLTTVSKEGVTKNYKIFAKEV